MEIWHYDIFTNGTKTDADIVLSKKDIIYLYIFTIFVILGLKRIQILAIILMFIYAFLSSFFNNKIKLIYFVYTF